MYGDQSGELVCGYLGLKALSKRHAGVQLGTDECRGVVIKACVASVSVWFRSKERPKNGIFVLAAREMEREPKYSPPAPPLQNSPSTPPRSFTRPIFHAVFDSSFSFIAPSLLRRLW